jgi:hypothetical protein
LGDLSVGAALLRSTTPGDHPGASTASLRHKILWTNYGLSTTPTPFLNAAMLSLIAVLIGGSDKGI